MRIAIGLAWLLVPALASARPLPAGMKVSLAKGAVMVARDGVTVKVAAATSLTGAELSEDGKVLVIRANERIEIPLAKVEARLVNGRGMALHAKKKFAEAAPHFARAAQLDPATPMYATNLLSAQSMGGTLDEADRTLATYGKRAAPWFAWRLVVDPELAAVAGRASAKFGPVGKATSRLVDAIAYSPLGYAASEVFSNASMGDGSGGSDTELAIVDLTSGAEVLRLPAEHTCGEGEGAGCEKAQAPITAKQRKVADAVLARLGFEVVAGGYHSTMNEETAVAADGRKVTFDGTPKLIAGKVTKELGELDRIYGVGFVPKAVVIVSKDVVQADDNGLSIWQAQLTAYPTP